MWSYFEVDSRIVEKDMILNNYNVIYTYIFKIKRRKKEDSKEGT